MGEIQKQSIRGTVFIYAGAIIGFLTSGILFPRLLSTEQIGLVNVLVSYATIFSLIASLGFLATTTKMFPFFRDKSKNHNGFVFLGSSISLIGFVLVGIIFFFINKYFIFDEKNNSDLLQQYSFLIYPLSFFIVLYNFLDNYNKALFNASRGLFLKEFLLRIVIVCLIIGFAIHIIDFGDFVYLYVASYSIPLFIIMYLLSREGQLSYVPRKGIIDKSLIKPVLSISFFGILSTTSAVITFQIDRIMVEDMVGLSAAGIYSTCFFFGTLVILPSRAILKISSTYIADSFRNKDIEMISSIYHKTSLNQYILGCLIFIGLWVNDKNIISILGTDFIEGKWVVFFIGLAYLSDMLSGASTHIIANSDYYKAQSVFSFALIVVVVIFNLIFIPYMGLVGAAVASFLAKFAFNLAKFIFIWHKFKLQPYNLHYVYISIVAILAYLAGYFTPGFDNYIFDIAVRSSITASTFLILTYLFNISEELSLAANNLTKKVFKR
ncbi:MAG: oligosaccharide flippase family protein [Bacteroidales bacterium]|nr:oligosaccharide flippase family protein [Bacteroidales bacterium]MCF8456462.1 oligosaccharide flippase family protein [Bacteroidales bacterium]